MNTTTYGFASPHGYDTGLIRIGGLGLANLLFSWARCALFCKANEATQIFTTWPQIKRESWLRWDPDKRLYWGLFHPLEDELSGIKKLVLLRSANQTPEREWKQPSAAEKQIVVFRGFSNYFLDIPHREYEWIRQRFLSMIQDQELTRIKTNPHIGVHIRLGDKVAYNSCNPDINNMQLPMSWYMHVVQTVAAELSGSGYEIGVCSDAREDELLPVLRLPNVRLVRGRTALEDLMYLATSRLLIGSFSTFSQWGAYLANCPSIWHPLFNRRGGLGTGRTEMLISEESVPDKNLWRKCIEEAAANTGSRSFARTAI